jgi:CheY-like chemotaxis protein
VLIIDDEKTFRVVAQAALEAEGLEARCAASGGDGLAAARDMRPDVVVLDRNLPDADGLAVLERLRVEAAGDEPLVVMATAFGEIENAVQALKLGAFDYLTKPIQLAALVLAVSGYPVAMACSCACDGSYTVEDYINQATVIVVGRVVEVRSKPVDSDPLTEQSLSLMGDDTNQLTVISSCGAEWVRVVVTDQLKGVSRAELTLAHEAIGTDCDVKFSIAEGKEYLLFALPSRDGGTLYLSGCSPSLPVAKAKRMIKLVRKQLAGAS